MKTLFKLSALTLGLALASTVSYADTVSMTFNSVGGASNGTDYIYPYYFNINGSNALTSLMCVSYDDEIYQGESWMATTAAITTASSVTDQEDAFLFSQLSDSTYTTLEIQEEAWYLSDPSGGATNDAALLASAESAVTSADRKNSTSGASFDDGEYTLFTPVAGSQNPNTDGTPQSFVGATAPEPGALLLLATGLLGLAGAFYRRRSITL